ncbi:MAG: condensation domain-containing protein, partial [Opitutaceae bacterium]
MKVYSERGLDSYSLSSLQQGMLAHSLASTGCGVDVEQVVCELHEEIAPAQFQNAWGAVIARHPVLRTSFHWETEDEPHQVVHATADVEMPFRYDEFDGEQKARRGLEDYLTSDRAAGFDPAVAPLLRVALIRGGVGRYWFVTTFHHLVLDGRAMVTVFREALDIHDALVAGEPLGLKAPTEFRDYIAWLETLDLVAAEKFWREQLKGFSAPTVLPLARTSPGEAQANGIRGELAMRFDPEVVDR